MKRVTLHHISSTPKRTLASFSPPFLTVKLIQASPDSRARGLMVINGHRQDKWDLATDV